MILGIDYGLKNIGLAISEGELAEPWGTLSGGDLQKTIREVGEVREKLGIELIVVGISEGKSKEGALEFGRRLAAVLRLPVEYADETLSTVEVNKGYGGGRGNKGREHARAAAVILQRYLDTIRSNR